MLIKTKNKLHFLLLGLIITLPFTSKSWAGLKVDSNGDPTIELEAGELCYTDDKGNVWVATIFETNCNDANQAFVMDDGGAGYEECPQDISTLESDGSAFACSYNSMTTYDNLEGYRYLVTCVSEKRTQGKSLYDWQYTFLEKPDYIEAGSPSTTSRAGSYFTDEDYCDILIDEFCHIGEYYNENEYRCINCPNGGTSSGGEKIPITECYWPNGFTGKDINGNFKINGGDCYYK